MKRWLDSPVAVANQDHVAPTLTDLFLAERLKYDNFAATEARQPSHQATTSICWVSIVSGIPRSERTAKHATIASLTLSTASSFVVP